MLNIAFFYVGITLPCIHMTSSTVTFTCHKSSDLKLFFVQSYTLSSGGSPPSPYIRVWSWSRFVPVQRRFFYSCCSFRFQALGFFKFSINQVFWVSSSSTACPPTEEPSMCYYYDGDGMCEDFEQETGVRDCGLYTPNGFLDQWAATVEVSHEHKPYCSGEVAAGYPAVTKVRFASIHITLCIYSI